MKVKTLVGLTLVGVSFLQGCTPIQLDIANRGTSIEQLSADQVNIEYTLNSANSRYLGNSKIEFYGQVTNNENFPIILTPTIVLSNDADFMKTYRGRTYINNPQNTLGCLKPKQTASFYVETGYVMGSKLHLNYGFWWEIKREVFGVPWKIK